MTPLRYLSLCSGIEAATSAWHDLGWLPIAFAEIEAFPSSVLASHWPHVPNLGDMSKWREWPEDLLAQVDILVGGTPCQAFSVAGLRNSLDDERGNLTLIYAHLLNHLDTLRAERGLPPVICLWENVPGVLSTKDNAFGCFLGALAGEELQLQPPGRKWGNAGYVRGPQRAVAWRILDAQYFGVAQRRRRVFLVAGAGDGFRPEQILFESEGVRRDSPPSREPGEEITPTIRAGATSGSAGHGARSGDSKDELIVPCWWDGGQVSQTLDAVLAKGQTMPEKNRFPAVLVDAFANKGHFGSMSEASLSDPLRSKGGDTGHGGETLIVHTLRGTGFDASEDGTGRGTPLVCVHGTQDPCVSEHTAFALGRNHGGENVVGIAENMRGEVRETDYANALTKGGGKPGQGYAAVRQVTAVRRLTPTECERLQGFPDSHTDTPHRGKPAADGPRYKALGNSMAVPCMAWLGRRIAAHLSPRYYTQMTPQDFLDSDYADLLETELLVPHYLILCCAYYSFFVSIVEDRQFDLLARRLAAEWADADHPHRHLIDRSALASGGSYLTGRYPLRVIGAARMLIADLKLAGDCDAGL